MSIFSEHRPRANVNILNEKRKERKKVVSHRSKISFSKSREPRHFAGRYPVRGGGFTLVADIPRISELKENLLHCGEIIEGRYRAGWWFESLYSAVRAG